MSNWINTVCKALTIEESNRNVDLDDTAQPIKHTQIKWTNYTATPGKCTLTRLVKHITLPTKQHKIESSEMSSTFKENSPWESMTPIESYYTVPFSPHLSIVWIDSLSIKKIIICKTDYLVLSQARLNWFWCSFEQVMSARSYLQ